MQVNVPKSDELWSHTVFDPAASIVDLFRIQAAHRPDAIAIIQDGESLRYSELAVRADQIAARLRRAGIRRGDRVAILAPRSIDMVAAQLGVMSAGAAFVAVDPASPEALQRDILDQSGARVILVGAVPAEQAARLATESRPVCAISPLVVRDSDAEDTPAPDEGPSADDLAYVIFTSGSTGRPKGVMIPHRGVCRLVRGQDYADFSPDQVMLHMAAIGFDVIIIETYGALLNGGTLVILPDAAPSLDRIGQVIRDHGVTFAFITAGLFHVVAENRPEILEPLSQVCPCGDVLSETHVKRVRRLLPDLRIINGYGPTENSVSTCFYTIGPEWTGGPIPIGKGIAHDHLFVLDEDLRPLPRGEFGQLAVGGPGVAIGYLGREDLTAAAFVPLKTPEFEGRVYLTGDLVKMRPDGVVLFHGRVDRQIKINGQRVELDAVEHALRKDRAVEDAAVVATRRPDGSRAITAFIKPGLAGLSAQELTDAVLAGLREKMPPAAIPARILVRDTFPLSAAGKVDRKRLAAELEGASATPRPDSAPTELRDVVRQVWGAVLGREIVEDDKTFFDLGGTSLQLIAVHAQLQERLGRTFDIARLFEAPRIAELVRLLEGGAPAKANGGRAAKAKTTADEDDPIAARRAAMMRARSRRARA